MLTHRVSKDGEIADRQIDCYYVEHAKGGAGAIINNRVSEEGGIKDRQTVNAHRGERTAYKALGRRADVPVEDLPITIRDNFEPPEPIRKLMPIIPPRIHLDAREAFDSLIRMKKEADIIVPLHDPEFAFQSTIP
jgi:hypothetical protein